MKKTFVIKQKIINGMLASMQPICSKRTPLESTTGILFQIGLKELVLKATDLEISLQYSATVSESSLTDNVEILVPGKRIFDLVKELDEELFFTINNQEITIAAGGAKAHLNLKDVEMFPDFPERIENLLHLDAAFVKGMLDKVSFIIPQTNPNSALNGLYIEIGPEGFTATATDGHCLAQVKSTKYALSNRLAWLVPRRAVSELKKILDTAPDETIFIGTCGNQLVFSGESFNFFTKLLNDKFPQYGSILNKEGFIAAKVDRNSFVRTIRRSACLLSGQFLPTTFIFEDEAVGVSLVNKEVGAFNDRIALTGYQGDMLQIRFYAPYLLGGLQNFTENELQFYLHNFAKPIIFESTEENLLFSYLVMPVSPTNNV
jgi:DNA polymerase-3 subunit beta